MCGMWSRAKGGATHPGKALRLGCSLGRRRETDAVFEMRKEAMRVEGVSAEETARVFGFWESNAAGKAVGCGPGMPFCPLIPARREEWRHGCPRYHVTNRPYTAPAGLGQRICTRGIATRVR